MAGLHIAFQTHIWDGGKQHETLEQNEESDTITKGRRYRAL